MSFSYSGNPLNSAADQVRFLVGDTDKCDVLLQDGEIQYLLSLYNNVPLNAAVRACETIISKFSRLADESVGEVRIDYSQRAKAYRDTMAMLRRRLAIEGAMPYAGGISVSDKMTNAQNTDRVKPDFTKHMMENDQIAPWTSQQLFGFFWDSEVE